MWLATNNKQARWNECYFLIGWSSVHGRPNLLAQDFWKNLESFLFLLADRHVLLHYTPTWFLQGHLFLVCILSNIICLRWVKCNLEHSQYQGFWYFAWSRSREIRKNMQNTAKFGRNLIKYMSVQQFWKLLGVFTCHKVANLCQNSVTEMCKQCSVTTRRELCCEKLGTSHNVKGFTVGSFLECIVVGRANHDLC